MESGIIELAPVFKGSTETTAEKMKEYMQGVVTRFCGVTGLVVTGMVDHEKGAFFILGEEGKDQGLVAIGNSNNNGAYITTMVVSNTGPGNEIRLGITAYGNINNGDGQIYQFSSLPVWMKYVRTDHGMVIGLQAAASPSVQTPVMALQKIRSGDTEELAMLRIYSSALYAAYNPALLNEVKNTWLFAQSGLNKNIIPPDKEAMAEICLESRAELPGMRLYTNKKRAEVWNMVRVGGVQYIVASRGNFDNGSFTLLMQASDPEPQA